MGCLCSNTNKQWEQILAEEKARSRELEKNLRIDFAKEEQMHKLLLLGAGESGKSTIFKQMKGIHGGGWNVEERNAYKAIVFSNIVTSIKTLIEMSFTLKEHGATGTDIDPPNQASAELIRNLDDHHTVIDSKLAAQMNAVWWDKGIQRTWDYRAMYYLTDSAAYFLDKVVEVGQEGYVPTEQDVLRSRVRTTGIVENSFKVEQSKFKIYDVGGQRNERKKWIHCFSEVTAVLFVAALSGYDMVLYEDQDTNRMHEALELFEEICNSKYFKKTAMILFLNKRDLFHEKISTVPLTVCFPEYTGPQDYENGVLYIENKFRSVNKDPGKPVHCHVTCATDTSNVATVFGYVKKIVISGSLAEANLIPGQTT